MADKEMYKVCFHCGKTIRVSMDKKRLIGCRPLRSLFSSKDLFYKFFEIDPERKRKIDFNKSHLCLVCHALVKDRTLQYNGMMLYRKLKLLPNGKGYMTIRTGENSPAATQHSDICYEHSYSEIHPEPLGGPVLARIPPGPCAAETFCFNCGTTLPCFPRKNRQGKKRAFEYLKETCTPEECKEIFDLEFELTEVQQERFPEARICNKCAQHVRTKRQIAVNEVRIFMDTDLCGDQRPVTNVCANSSTATDAYMYVDGSSVTDTCANGFTVTNPRAVSATCAHGHPVIATCAYGHPVVSGFPPGGFAVTAAKASGYSTTTSYAYGSPVTGSLIDQSTVKATEACKIYEQQLAQQSQFAVSNSTYSAPTVSRDSAANSVPVTKTTTIESFRQRVCKLVAKGEYKQACRAFVGASPAARAAIVDACCILLRNEKKKYLPRHMTYFSQTVTDENFEDFSLEEAAHEAEKVSPNVVKCLRAIMPQPVRPGKSVLKGCGGDETMINSRLGCMMGVALYTNTPMLKFIQSCIGLKLFNQQTSTDTMNWLHSAGLSNTRQTALKTYRDLEKRKTQAAAERLLDPAPEPRRSSRETKGQRITPRYCPKRADLLSRKTRYRRHDEQEVAPTAERQFHRLFTSKFIMQSQIGNNRKPCPKCSKVFPDTNAWKRHLRSVHAADRRFMCSVCEKTFSAENLLQKHEAWYHNLGAYPRPLKPPRRQPCPKCGKILGQDGLRKHLRKVHAADRQFMCTICKRTYSSEALLQNHVSYFHNPKSSKAAKRQAVKQQTSSKNLSTAGVHVDGHVQHSEDQLSVSRPPGQKNGEKI